MLSSSSSFSSLRTSSLLQERLSSSPIFSMVRVTRSLVLCVCFVVHSLSLCTFSFGHYVKVKFILINLMLSSSSSFSSLRTSSLLLKVALVCLCSTMSDCRLLITVFNCRRSLSDFSCSPSLCLHLQNKDTIII
jgi:hypothetical protein